MPHAVARIDALPMRLVRLWTRLRLPRAHRLLRSAGVWDPARWRGEPTRQCRGARHGYRIALDISDFHQRGTYFYGQSLDPDVQLCILACLRRGDTFIDVGANIGMHALLGAWAVGARGRVVAFEPNPDVYSRLSWHISENRLSQIEAHALALSDRETTMRLTVPPTHNTGAATLGALPPRHGGRIGAVYDVPVRIGDDLLAGLSPGPALIKLDVEGHETSTLRGLRRTIESHRPTVLLECNVEMLPHNGSSADELCSLLEGWGYRPFGLGLTWKRLARRWQLHLDPRAEGWRPHKTENLLYLHPGSPHRARVEPLIAG